MLAIKASDVYVSEDIECKMEPVTLSIIQRLPKTDGCLWYRASSFVWFICDFKSTFCDVCLSAIPLTQGSVYFPCYAALLLSPSSLSEADLHPPSVKRDQGSYRMKHWHRVTTDSSSKWQRKHPFRDIKWKRNYNFFHYWASSSPNSSLICLDVYLHSSNLKRTEDLTEPKAYSGMLLSQD